MFSRRSRDIVGYEIERFLPGFFSELSGRMPEGRLRMFAFQLVGRGDGGTFPVEMNVAAWESEDGALLLSFRR